jgi:hypothetical protein
MRFVSESREFKDARRSDHMLQTRLLGDEIRARCPRVSNAIGANIANPL